MTNHSVSKIVSIGFLSVGISICGITFPVYAFSMQRGDSFGNGSVSSQSSPNGCFTLFNQGGNYIIENNQTGNVMWQSRTNGKQTGLWFQPDGNLVIYDESYQENGRWIPLWASGTDQRDGSIVKLQDDGNLVMYTRSNRAIWSSDRFDGSYWNRRCR